jgi:hypothetical protein
MVELVGLTPSAWREHGISAQVKPKEVEDAARYAGRIGGQIFIAHEVRLDLEHDEPGPPGCVVFVDGLDEGVDLLEVEARFVPWQGGVVIRPEMRLLCASRRDRLRQRVISPQIHELDTAESPGQ